MDSLVSAQWLAAEYRAADVRVVDASWFLPTDRRHAAAEFAAGHLPGAIFLDLANLADKTSGLPMTLPQPDEFATRVAALGLRREDRIVLYDNSPHVTSARAWFMLAQVYGFSEVFVLDGGLAKWVADGFPLEMGVRMCGSVAAKVIPSNHGQVRTKADMLQNLETCSAQIIDARGHGRFSGEEPEPRPEIASGHIPGAVNLPFPKLFNPDGTWKRGAALQAEFETAGIDLDRPMIATCGSGVTACVLLFGLHLLGRGDAALYDGSWAEWGADPHTPKATGR